TVAETLPVALAFAAQATLLALFGALRAPVFDVRPPAAAAFAYAALVLTVNRALLGEKRRLSTTLAELARLKHGIGQLEDLGPGAPLRSAGPGARPPSFPIAWCPWARTRSRSSSTAPSPSTPPTSSACSGTCPGTAGRREWAPCWRSP